MTKQIIELEVKSGLSIYVEAEPEDAGDVQELSGGSPSRLEKAFSDITKVLCAVAEDIQEQFGALKEHGPKKVVVELHAQVKGGGKLYIINGEAQGGIKVQMTWERS